MNQKACSKNGVIFFFFGGMGVGGRMRGHCLGFCVVFILFFYLVVRSAPVPLNGKL